MGRFGLSPGVRALGAGVRIWHKMSGNGLPACNRVHRTELPAGWTLSDRLPPRADAHCRVCFPAHDPGPVPDYRPADWAEGLIQTALKESK
jgi:hypothetical protein